MKSRHATLIGLLLFVFSIPALADNGGLPWDKLINNPGRFVVLQAYNNEAVLDRETSLVWELSPDTTARIWGAAQVHCNNEKTIGNRKGWRLPTAQELASLIDPSVPRPGPTLPAGHPFTNVQSNDYWSATAQADSNGSNAYSVGFVDAFLTNNMPKVISLFVWCVRGGQGPDLQ